MMRVTQRKTASGRWTKNTVFWKLFHLAAKQREKTVSLGLLCDPRKLEILRIEKNQIKEEIPMLLSSFVFFFQSKEKLQSVLNTKFNLLPQTDLKTYYPCIKPLCLFS